MMSSLDQYGQYGNVNRINSRYPRRLSQRLWTMFFQLLAAFKTNRSALVIVKPPWNRNGLVLLCPLRRLFLLLDIRCVVTHNLYFI